MASQNVSLGVQRSRDTSVVEYLTRRHVRDRIFQAAIYATLILCSILVALPFLWMLSTSLKRPGTEFVYPVQWIQNPPRWGNFVAAWTVLPFNSWAINTIVITLGATIGHVISSA
jgi:multiple sugar transport system permease protein